MSFIGKYIRNFGAICAVDAVAQSLTNEDKRKAGADDSDSASAAGCVYIYLGFAGIILVLAGIAALWDYMCSHPESFILAGSLLVAGILLTWPRFSLKA